MGEGYRNEVHYNPFGTILGICGFGNISAGKINLYDTEQREEIIALEVPDTITFEVISTNLYLNFDFFSGLRMVSTF